MGKVGKRVHRQLITKRSAYPFIRGEGMDVVPIY